MSVKTVAIVVDDFSTKALSYPNITYYDYGTEINYSLFDDYYIDRTYNFYNNQLIDYGDVDGSTINWSESAYFHSSQFYTTTAVDFVTLGPVGSSEAWWPYLDHQFLDYTDEAKFQELLPATLSTDESSGVACHGDWVLEAFFSQLDNANDVEVIAIDIDFDGSGDITNLFSSQSGSTVFEAIVGDAINRFYVEGNTYLLAGMNASFGGGDVSLEGAVIDSLLNDDAFVVQAAPNLGQAGIAWGDYYPNVINVGAWNVDQNNQALAASMSSLDAIDLYADGYVEKADWGWTFGTSFAAPRVFAEVINYFDEYVIPYIEDGSIQVDPNADLSDAELTQVTNGTVDAISTDIDVLVSGLDYWVGPVNVLSDDVQDTPAPVLVPASMPNLGITSIQRATQ